MEDLKAKLAEVKKAMENRNFQKGYFMEQPDEMLADILLEVIERISDLENGVGKLNSQISHTGSGYPFNQPGWDDQTKQKIS